MQLEALRQARRRTVGTKQTAKAVERGNAEKVFVARDADERVVRHIIKLCEENGVEIQYIETMSALGKACGIDVGAASAAILKEEPGSGR
ncbi:MAG: ribosomal L7Ae/L30e/S12e/Gadd45 family protein [Firmicutes bacterium]|jgi:large subunit ribosomal protein L7A|nr:ribosomal L7Ae/L30e/S12e/Gadd45 family protein [Bacillota bacterium]